jgi:hypothetical protein
MVRGDFAMKAFPIGSILVICLVQGACSYPLAPTIHHATIGDFTDHVLEPLALRVADEKISEASARLKVEYTPKASLHTVTSLLYDIPWIGRLLNVSNVSRKAQWEEDLAWLESQRIPLKRELLDLFVSRTTYQEETFTLCVDGVQRRYQALDTNRFTRLVDGPGPCDLTPLHSLRKAHR